MDTCTKYTTFIHQIYRQFNHFIFYICLPKFITAVLIILVVEVYNNSIFIIENVINTIFCYRKEKLIIINH